MDIEIIKGLSKTARVDMSESEMIEIANSFGSILDYVGHIQEVSANSEAIKEIKGYIPQNILREDIVTNQTAKYREDIITQFPQEENGFLKVKQIL